MTPTIMKLERQTPFSECIHVLKFHRLLIDSLEVTLEIH